MIGCCCSPCVGAYDYSPWVLITKGAVLDVISTMAALQVIQTYARANKLPLDVMMFTTEVTNKTVEQVTEPASLGCYIHGCVLEGARCAYVGWRRPSKIIGHVPLGSNNGKSMCCPITSPTVSCHRHTWQIATL